MKRRFLALLLAVTVVFTLAGCGGKTEENGASSNGVQTYSFGDENRDALRVLLDFGHGVSGGLTQPLYEFSQQLEKHYGITDVSFEVLPASGAERETIVARTKVEIMSGEGPDVCIVQPSGARSIEDENGNHNPLFPYPQKVMEAGIFLPLDDYMENHSKLTDWSKQQQTVLAAGRNAEGQQIIPLTYTFPVLCYPQSTVQMDKPDTLLSWNDIIEDPESITLYGGLIDCGLATEYGPGSYPYLDFVLGRLADFEQEELLFTEEELLQRVQEINALPLLEEPSNEGDWFDDVLGYARTNRDYPLTMLPLYSDDGGITASIGSFAVVNRNTSRPQDAYAVIDVLMSEYMQQKSSLYTTVLLSFEGIPLNMELCQTAKPIGFETILEENSAELNDLRGQITAANYHDDLSMDLQELLMNSRTPDAYGQTVEQMVQETYELMQRKVRE